MTSDLTHKLFYVAVGAMIALGVVGFYWQTNKQTLAKKVLGSVAWSNQCLEENGTSENVDTASESDDVYFVGCGGFF